MQTVIQTNTREQYDTLLRYLESKGYSWAGGGAPTSPSLNLDLYKPSICICLEPDKQITYCDREYFERYRRQYHIISLDDFMPNLTLKLVKIITSRTQIIV